MVILHAERTTVGYFMVSGMVQSACAHNLSQCIFLSCMFYFERLKEFQNTNTFSKVLVKNSINVILMLIGATVRALSQDTSKDSLGSSVQELTTGNLAYTSLAVYIFVHGVIQYA